MRSLQEKSNNSFHICRVYADFRVLLNMKHTLLTLLGLSLFIGGCGLKENEHSQEFKKRQWKELRIEAPFGTVKIKEPKFPDREFNINDFGASPDDINKNTEAIKKAIEACSNAGGGHVVVPSGKWQTGKIHLKNDVDLHLEKGAELIFSDNPQDYLPAVRSSWEGMECFNYSPLIYAYECTNVALTGEGTITATMGIWEKWFGRPPAHLEALKQLYDMAAKDVPVEQRQMAVGDNHFRPQFIQFNRCKNVLIQDIKIRNSPFWVIHLLLSSDVVVRGVDVKAHGHNNDGVDPEMTQNLLIEDCTFDQGDDAVAIKSGRNRDAWRLNSPTQNVVIRNCTIIEGHQMVAIGSELSGGVRNVYVHDCVFPDKDKITLGNLMFIKTNPRRGGFVQNIFMENIKAGKLKGGVLSIETDVLYQWKDLVPTYEVRYTKIEDIYIKNIEVDQADVAININGDPSLPVEGIFLNDIVVKKVTGTARNYKNVTGIEEKDLVLGRTDPK